MSEHKDLLSIRKQNQKEEEIGDFPRTSQFPSDCLISSLFVSLILTPAPHLVASLYVSFCLSQACSLSLFVSPLDTICLCLCLSVSQSHCSVFFFLPDIKGQKRNLACLN